LRIDFDFLAFTRGLREDDQTPFLKHFVETLSRRSPSLHMGKCLLKLIPFNGLHPIVNIFLREFFEHLLYLIDDLRTLDLRLPNDLDFLELVLE
jgi:hypothetical protein